MIVLEDNGVDWRDNCNTDAFRSFRSNATRRSRMIIFRTQRNWRKRLPRSNFYTARSQVPSRYSNQHHSVNWREGVKMLIEMPPNVQSKGATNRILENLQRLGHREWLLGVKLPVTLRNKIPPMPDRSLRLSDSGSADNTPLCARLASEEQSMVAIRCVKKVHIDFPTVGEIAFHRALIRRFQHCYRAYESFPLTSFNERLDFAYSILPSKHRTFHH